MTDRQYIDNQIHWLKNHCDAEFKAVRQAVEKVETTNKDAVDKVATDYKTYREQQNEWRGQIKDDRSGLVTRRELAGAVVAIVAIITSFITIIMFFIRK